MESLEPNLYEKLSSKGFLNRIDKTKHFDDVEVTIEDSYCDKNMLVLSFSIKYQEGLGKLQPRFVLDENSVVFQGGGRKLSDLKDEYVLVVIPEDDIENAQNINIDFLNSQGDKEFTFSSNIVKNIKNNFLEEFLVISCEDNNEFANLFITPYGMVIKIHDNLGHNRIKMAYNSAEEVSPTKTTVTEDDETICVFNQAFSFENYDEIKDSFSINLHADDVDENLIESINCKLKKISLNHTIASNFSV